jgi:hypothetical protein
MTALASHPTLSQVCSPSEFSLLSGLRVIPPSQRCWGANKPGRWRATQCKLKRACNGSHCLLLAATMEELGLDPKGSLFLQEAHACVSLYRSSWLQPPQTSSNPAPGPGRTALRCRPSYFPSLLSSNKCSTSLRTPSHHP